MGQAWLALVALVLVAGLGLSAHAGISGGARVAAAPILAGADAVPMPDAAPADAPPRDAFAEIAAPAAGVTGTTALPALPVPAIDAAADGRADPGVGVVAARPFSTAQASATDRARALQCLTAAIYYEAASEPDAGQHAVAQVVLNRVRHPAFPASVCGVVYQGSERAGCQFSFACDGAMARTPSAAGWARAARAAGAALAGYVYAPIGLATHYHTYAVTPAWNRSLVMTDMVGAHLFHRWKGWWGTAAAFRQAYAGGEPVPGPHAPMVSPVPPGVIAAAGAFAVPPLPVGPPVVPVTPRAQVQPGYVESGAALALPPAAAPRDTLPPASQVLDRWKDSGTPLDPRRNAGGR